MALPGQVVRRLLEDTEEGEADDFFLKATASPGFDRDIRTIQFPEELREWVQHAPDDFIEALGTPGAEATFSSDPDDYGEWWPSYDGTNEEYPWTQLRYEAELNIDDGQLHLNVFYTDPEGYRDFSTGDLYSPQWRQQMLTEFSDFRWHEAMEEYYFWVAEFGKDPLEYIAPPRVPLINEVWRFRLQKDGEGTRFVNAQSGDKKYTTVSRLPEEVRDYMTVDPDGSTDISWASVLTFNNPPELESEDRAVLTFELKSSGKKVSEHKLKAYYRKAARQAALDHKKHQTEAAKKTSFVIP